MPSPYKPPLPRRTQAVQTARVPSLRRVTWWWLVPLLGLVPVVVAAVLASEGRFGNPGGPPVAGGPAATATQAASGAAKPAPAQPGAPQAQPTPPRTSSTTSQVAPNPAPATQAPQTAGTQTARTSSQSVGQPTAPASDAAQATGPFRAYRVQPGDTVRFVAEMYGVSAASIAQASGLQNADRLRIGQILTIPAQPGWLYRMQPGETLDQVAARTGVPTDLIVSASKLANDAVRAGDVILIPDQAAAPSK